MDNSFYAIITVVTVLYTLITILGFITALREFKRHIRYVNDLHKVIQEIKQLLTKEELMENKDTVSKGVGSKLTLNSLITTEPTDGNYEELLELLADLCKKTFEDYKFLIAKSPDETQDAHFLQIVSRYEEAPEVHRALFKKAIDYGIDTLELQKRFATYVRDGKVLDLGDEIKVIVNDGSNSLPTGVSQINSGLEGGEIAFIISFLKKENWEAWWTNKLKEKGLTDEEIEQAIQNERAEGDHVDE